MRGLLILLLFFFTIGTHLFSQVYILVDNFKFKFIKAKKASGGNYYYTIKTDKRAKKVQVRFKMKSLSGQLEDFDPNKFYLVYDYIKEKNKTFRCKK